MTPLFTGRLVSLYQRTVLLRQFFRNLLKEHFFFQSSEAQNPPQVPELVLSNGVNGIRRCQALPRKNPASWSFSRPPKQQQHSIKHFSCSSSDHSMRTFSGAMITKHLWMHWYGPVLSSRRERMWRSLKNKADTVPDLGDIFKGSHYAPCIGQDSHSDLNSSYFSVLPAIRKWW